jgi:hypothetical protein
MSEPLRYNISNWLQLSECRSNNSADLYITIKQVIDDGSHRLTGIIILVQHTQYGTLFACIINSSGSLLTPDPVSGKIKEFTTDEILAELNKFGFDVTFEINQHLSGDQISFLMTVNDLGYDKLRVLSVQDKPDGHYSDYLVVFNVEKCPDWIYNDYTCGKKVFVDALTSSGAMNITDLPQTKGFDWTWLTYVANIDDIIEDNGYTDEE